MGRYVIERTLPGAGALGKDELHGISAKSNSVLAELGPDVSWVESYVTDDKLYCVYDATDPDLIAEHVAAASRPTRSAPCGPRSRRRPAADSGRVASGARQVPWPDVRSRSSIRGRARGGSSLMGSAPVADAQAPATTGHPSAPGADALVTPPGQVPRTRAGVRARLPR